MKELQIDSAKVNTGDGDKGSTFTLPENLHKAEFFDGVKDVDDLANQAFGLAGQVWDLTSKRPVVPEKPDGYEVSIPDGAIKDEKLTENFLKEAHAAGMTQAQVKAVLGIWNGWVGEKAKEAQDGRKAAVEAAEKGLKDTWLDKHDENMGLVMRLLRTFGTEELKAELLKSGRANSVEFTQFLHRIAGKLSEDVFVSGDDIPPKKMPTTLGGNPVFDYSKSMPEHYKKGGSRKTA